MKEFITKENKIALESELKELTGPYRVWETKANQTGR